MTLSAKWQKFYQWYCYVSWLLAVVVMLLIAIGYNVWETGNEPPYFVALFLCRVLFVTTLFGIDLILWMISFVVWCCRRESASGWTIFGYGLVMTVLKLLNLGSWVALTGGV